MVCVHLPRKVAVVAPVHSLAAGTDRWVGSGSKTEVRTEGTRTIVGLRGEWDLSTRAALADVLSRAIASDKGDVVIDLGEAEFVDTATVRAFIVCQQLLNSRGHKLTFWAPSSLATRLFGVFGITDVIERREGPHPFNQ
jgi:anti-anti-sigma factor